MASSGGTGASSLIFVCSHHFARTHLANDAKVVKKGAVGDNLMGWLMSTERNLNLMELLACTVGLTFHVLVSLFSVVCTSECIIH